MTSRDKVVLEKILKYCEETLDAKDHFGDKYDIFVSSSVYRNAVNMCILQIGELCKLLSIDLRKEIPEIPWKQWCGIRDVFAHQYENIDLESTWDTLHSDMPVLKKAIEGHLTKLKG